MKAFDSSVNQEALVAKIQGGDPRGKGELHRLFYAGIRFLLQRRLGPEHLEARVQETFTILVSRVQTEDLREDELLAGLVCAIIRNQVAAYDGQDDRMIRSQPSAESPGAVLDHRVHPDKKSIRLQNQDVMVWLLRNMTHHEQEALTRFYFHKQTPARICQELEFSETQLLLLNESFKANFRKAMATSKNVTS